MRTWIDTEGKNPKLILFFIVLKSLNELNIYLFFFISKKNSKPIQ